MAVDTRYVTHSKWTSLTATELTYPDGRQVTSGYDALYRRNTVTETSGGATIAAWQFFGGRTATVALGNGITCSFMNNAGTNSAVQTGVSLPAWGDKTTDRLGYDGSARMIAKRFLPSGSTTSLVGFTTDYDPSSNKLYERALQAESRSALYPGYDSTDRLLEYQRGTLASGGGSVSTPITLPGTDSQRTYNLDGLGNWKNTVFTSEGGSPTAEIRQHNKLNEITQFATTPVLYDHGNNASSPNALIAQRGNGNIADDGTRLYAYDALNRLTTVTKKSGAVLVATYTYDALGRRVEKIVAGGGIPGGIANLTYRYLYDGRQIVEEGQFPGGIYSLLRQNVWGQYIDELVQLKLSSSSLPFTAGTYYPLQDLLYRTTATTDSSMVIVEAYDYDAYGNTLMFSAAGTGGNWWADNATKTMQPMCEFLFTGRQYDPAIGIYWYRARYYLPGLGRFGGRDPLKGTTAPNLFEYVDSEPLAFVDPMGLQALVPVTRTMEPGTCGAVMFIIHWKLQDDPQEDGWVVQEITIKFKTSWCDAREGEFPKKCNTEGDGVHYWEAWPVHKTKHTKPKTGKPGKPVGEVGGKFMDGATPKFASDVDGFTHGSCGTCTKGDGSWTATARYYPGLDLPKSFVSMNRATWAGDLPSTDKDPMIPTDGATEAVSHELSIEWNCCPPNVQNKTTIKGRKPEK